MKIEPVQTGLYHRSFGPETPKLEARRSAPKPLGVT